MIRPALLCLLTPFMAIASCQTTMAEPAQDAILSQTDEKTRTAISKAVSKALDGRKVTLASDVLTQRPRLIMDPKFVNDRSFQKPDHFRLKVSGKDCYLLHEQTGTTYPLGRIKCRPVTP